MKTITTYLENEIVIKNSRFITCIIPLNEENIDDYLTKIKEKYPKATHYCYAYIFNDYKKASDDGEPSGTAGQPLLNVLEKENLNHVLIIVVRYFGGIKLGAGGLVRAYTKSLTEALKISNYQELYDGYKIVITFTYEEENNINYILKDYEIISKTFSDSITYISLVDDFALSKLNRYNVKILEKSIIKKP